jgi:Helix-turn-helix domain
MGEKDHILTKDEVYTSAEAMQIIGVSSGTLYNAVAEGTLHYVIADQVYGLHGKKRYLLRSEIDPLRGQRSLRKDMVRWVLHNPGLSERTIQEGTYGEEINMHPPLPSPDQQESEAMRAFRMLTEAFVDAFGNKDRNRAGAH